MKQRSFIAKTIISTALCFSMLLPTSLSFADSLLNKPIIEIQSEEDPGVYTDTSSSSNSSSNNSQTNNQSKSNQSSSPKSIVQITDSRNSDRDPRLPDDGKIKVKPIPDPVKQVDETKPSDSDESKKDELESPLNDVKNKKFTHEDAKRSVLRPGSDLENWEVIERQFVALVGDPSVDVVSIAKSQIGYIKTDEKCMDTEEYGRKYYTRYGEFMDRPYCTWCDAFVSFCVYYAGLDSYPLEISCLRHETDLKKAGYWREWNQYIPHPGDIVFLSLVENATSVTHVGIVEYIEWSDKNEAPKLHTIEGNVCVNGANVARCVRSFDDVIGYGTYTQIEIKDCGQTIRNDFAAEIPSWNGDGYVYPEPDKNVIALIGGTAVGYYNRLYSKGPSDQITTTYKSSSNGK